MEESSYDTHSEKVPRWIIISTFEQFRMKIFKFKLKALTQRIPKRSTTQTLKEMFLRIQNQI